MSGLTALEIKDVVKAQAHDRVVDGVSLDLKKGETLAILGFESGGRRDLLDILRGAALADQGEIYVLGLNVRHQIREIKSHLGVLRREEGLDPEFSAFENIMVFCGFHGTFGATAFHRCQEILKMMEIEDLADTAVSDLDSGQKRRVGLARALVNRPELLLLDGPTEEIGSGHRYWIWDFLRTLKKDQLSMVVGTDSALEAERLGDRIAIMDSGRIHAVGKAAYLIHQHVGTEVIELKTLGRDLTYYFGRLKSAGFECHLHKYTAYVFVKQGQSAQSAMELIAGDRVTLRRPSLDDVFLKLSGRILRDEP